MDSDGEGSAGEGGREAEIDVEIDDDAIVDEARQDEEEGDGGGRIQSTLEASLTLMEAMIDDDDEAIDASLRGLLQTQSESPAMMVPAAYWEARGHDAFYSQRIMDVFQRQLMNSASKLYGLVEDKRLGTINIGHDFDAHGNDREQDPGQFTGPAVMVEHDDILLPLWMNFISALRLAYRYAGGVYDMTVRNVQMNRQNSTLVLDSIGLAMRGRDLHSLNLLNVDLGKEGIVSVANILEGMNSLERIYLDGNRIEDLDAVQRLSSVVKRSPSTTLFLEGCGIGDKKDLLVAIMDGAQNLKHLGLSRNEIGPEGARAIADALKKNPGLEKLWLQDNRICDEGVGFLTGALKGNTNLIEMNLHRNEGVTETGKVAMADAILDTSSISAIVHSNHTCSIYYENCVKDERLHRANMSVLFWDGVESCAQAHQQHTDTIGEPAHILYSIRDKVRYALGADEGGPLDVQLLSDMRLEMMPYLIKFMQPAWSSERALGLKNVFEVMKNCVVPLLFANETKASNRKRKRE